MIKNFFIKITWLCLIVSVVGCSGLRYCYVAPEAKQFHPKRIAVFPIEIWNHKDSVDSRKVIEQMVSGMLVEKKWFANVLDTETLNKMLAEDETLSKVMKEYMTKLKELNYSDPVLSNKIAEIIHVDAFMMVTVDEWGYSGEKNKVAKVGMYMELYDATTGKLMWKASHFLHEDYVMLKPALTDMARELVGKMISWMPY
jgi:hypothetical protein